MHPTSTDIAANGIDTELLATLVIEMNILRRHVTAYPAGHPVPVAAAVKVARLVERLLDGTESVTLGIARDTLMMGDHPLDRKNPVYRDLARVLFDRGIVTLTCHRYLSPDELLRFGGLLARSREDIRGAGGIEKAAAAAGLSRLELRGIDYDLFRVTEEEWLSGQPDGAGGPSPLWEKFVRGMMDGTLDPFGDETEKGPPVDPELLARIMNGNLLLDQGGRHESYEAVITAFMRRMDREAEDGRSGREYAERLAGLAERLNPDLRRQFLGSTFLALGESPDAALQVISSMTEQAVLDALDELNDRNAAVPPLILNLCQKLGVTSSRGGEEDIPLSRATAARMGQKLGTIFREMNSQHYVPDAYQGKLERIIASGNISPGIAEADGLREAILGENLEAKVGAIILDIMEAEPEPTADRAEAGGMGTSLAELCAFYLEVGDFAALREFCGHLPPPGTEAATPLQRQLLAVVGTAAFQGPLVEAPAAWGKERYDDIRTIIRQVGDPCVEPLLERLAEEENMSLRRYYMGCLAGLGNAARDGAIARLGDDRWFYVRNLVALLRDLGDPAAVKPLRQLLGHPHPRVRQETLRTLAHFRDPEGERMLVRELESGNRETLLTAIQLSDRSRSSTVRDKLLTLLGRGGLAGPDVEVRCAVVRALAEAGDAAVLPGLARQLRAKSLLRSTHLNRLKVEIVRSLARYPADAALPLLREAADSGVDEVERAARETMRIVGGKSR
ncbi:MAG: HEAT repeat domain-containing protein [Desulfuromonadales bacterium]|nr:MAG: HEAT repeat domain-containing protein [Desulfuromonadales bacterium]